MSDKTPHRKSCDPQHSDQLPTEKWGVEELGQYAQARHEEIESQEQSLAVTYWQLGLALNFARQQFSHGQWAKFLDHRGIDKTRASKARAIQRSFTDEQAVQEMSVQEAYQHRKRKSRKSRPKTKHRQKNQQEQKTSMTDWLCDCCHKTDFYLGEVEFIDHPEAESLLPVLEQAVDDLTKLKNQIQQRIKTE